MYAAPLLGSFGSMMGMDGLLVVIVYFVPLAGLILLARRLGRGTTSARPEQRLQRLDGMRRDGSVTEAEYQEQRARIIAGI